MSRPVKHQTYRLGDGVVRYMAEAMGMRHPLDDQDQNFICGHIQTFADGLYQALVMVRDADNDCRADGLKTIPAAARARIDKAIAKAEGESRWS